jgi:hypothetical protein
MEQCFFCNGSGRGTYPYTKGKHLFNCSKCNGTGMKSGKPARYGVDYGPGAPGFDVPEPDEPQEREKRKVLK